jgi:endonuclease/exonuclease/phosphatase family metal-dependent hydrolase
MVKIVAWNMAHRRAAWPFLLDSDADIALLQEATEPPADVAARLSVDSAPWRTGAQNWRAAIAQLSNCAEVRWLESKPLADAHAGELGVSRPGTLAAATVTPSLGEPIIVVSVYAMWEEPHVATKGRFSYADASVHRLISDLSVFLSQQQDHNILVAGDLNVLYGYGEAGNEYWASRYATVFSRLAALGLSFVGPQAPAGRSAAPWPDELPPASKNVPTYHTNRQTPATCTRQLDFVFASQRLAKRLRVTALNSPNQWGPSDHCRVEIDLTESRMVR